MALEITIKPTLLQSINNTPSTELEVIIDLTTIYNLLLKYDLLLKVTLTVITSNSQGTKEKNIYEYSQIYRNITTTTIKFTTMVLGDIQNSSNLSAIAQGVLTNKI